MTKRRRITPREKIIRAVANNALIHTMLMPDIDALDRLVESAFNKPRYRLGESQRAYIATLTTDVKRKRFFNDLIREMQLQAEIDFSSQLAGDIGAFIDDETLRPIDALHLATEIAIDTLNNDLTLYRYGHKIATVYNTSGDLFSPVWRAVATWIPGDAPDDVNHPWNAAWFHKPTHLLMPQVKVDSQSLDFDPERLKGRIAAATHAVILKPENDIILFAGDPYFDGVAIAFVPQTMTGTNYSIANDFVKHYETVSTVKVGDVIVAEIVKRLDLMPQGQYEIDGILRLPDGVDVDYSLYNETIGDPSQTMTARAAAMKLAKLLYFDHVWSGQKSINISDPRICLSRYEQFRDNEIDRRGILLIKNENFKTYEYKVIPTVVSGDGDDAAADRVGQALVNDDVSSWGGQTDLFVRQADFVDRLIAAGIVTPDELTLIYEPSSKLTTANLDLINIDDDKHVQYIRALFDVVAASVMAVKCEFDVTRISGVHSNQFKGWLTDVLADALENNPTRDVALLIELTGVLFDDVQSGIGVTNDTKKRAFYVEQTSTPPDNDTAAYIWQTLLKSVNKKAQENRDLLNEIISVAGYDLAVVKRFDPDAIVKASNQIVQRNIRQTIAPSKPHRARWNQENADMKNLYAENVRSRALKWQRGDERPDYLQPAAL